MTLEEIGRLEGDWVRTPTGKFNAYDTAHDAAPARAVLATGAGGRRRVRWRT